MHIFSETKPKEKQQQQQPESVLAPQTGIAQTLCEPLENVGMVRTQNVRNSNLANQAISQGSAMQGSPKRNINFRSHYRVPLPQSMEIDYPPDNQQRRHFDGQLPPQHYQHQQQQEERFQRPLGGPQRIGI